MLRMLWVGCYDVAEDPKRRRLERVMARAGDRVQYSVFEAWLSEREHERLDEAVEQAVTLAPETDSIRWYGLCARCQAAVRFSGRGLRPTDGRFYIV